MGSLEQLVPNKIKRSSVTNLQKKLLRKVNKVINSKVQNRAKTVVVGQPKRTKGKGATTSQPTWVHGKKICLSHEQINVKFVLCSRVLHAATLVLWLDSERCVVAEP